MGNSYTKTVVAWQKRQRENGLCATCTSESPNSRICENCKKVKLESTRRKKITRISEGKCLHCNNLVFGNKRLCLTHFLKSTSSGRLGKYQYWEDLLIKYNEQNGLCFLTNDVLTPDNMELDHIVPISKGGTNDLSNVRWVTKDANRLKQDKSDADLIILCEKILKTLKNQHEANKDI
jgi:5-methylcytosine-specific restriction endonuclease McrA